MSICSNITGLDARNDSDNIPEQDLNETAKVNIEQLLQNQRITVSCDDSVGTMTLQDENDDFTQIFKENNTIINEIGNVEDVIAGHEPLPLLDMEIEETHKENKWSTWNPQALKTNVNSSLKTPVNKKISKAGVTAKLDELSKARLELVTLEKEIATKEHEFVKKEHELKMLSLQNEETRKKQC